MIFWQGSHANTRDLMKSLLMSSLMLASVGWVHGQITINSQDFFNEVGQYYRAYANKEGNNVSVSGKTGVVGGPQSWDFSSGPTDDIYRYDVVPANDGGHGDGFAEAQFAERQTIESTGTKSWNYYSIVQGKGRLNYGAYTDDTSLIQSIGAFDPPIVDFPEIIKYQDSWGTMTSFETVISLSDDELFGFEVPVKLDRSSNFRADAYGFVILPQLGFVEALRLNELVTYTIQMDLEGEGSYQTVGTYFMRTLYWMAKDKGVVAQMTSKEESAAPADNFSIASQFVRTFELSHPIATKKPAPVTDLKAIMGSPGSGQLLLSWSKTINSSSYRVEYTTNPLNPSGWLELGTTSSNFMLDAKINNNQQRFYRVVSLE